MDTSQNELHSETTIEGGFGLIEIVVSMFMLAILAIAFLPLLIQGLKISASNTTLATATQLVAEKMQLAQSKGPVCADVAAVAGIADLTDPRGVVLRVTTTTGTCAAGTTTLGVTTTVIRADTSAQLATATTLVYVGN